MRSIGMDVHKDFCEVAIVEDGVVRSGPRILTTPAALTQFAQSLSGTDQVAMENSGVAAAVAEIIRPSVARVVVANPQAVRAIAWAKVKTDKVDARTLARLLAAAFLPEVWPADQWTRALRRQVSRRVQLVRGRTRAKNEIHAVLARNLIGQPPMTDLFGVAGRTWLQAQALPPEEGEAVVAHLRQVDFFQAELDDLDARIARAALGSQAVRRLMTIPGFDMVAAAVLVSAIGDVSRFPTPRHLVGYLGLDPRVRQSGAAPARHGSISKHGSPTARHALVQAAWSAIRTPGPLRAFAQRVGARRGANVAAVAVARKLAVLSWHLLSRGEDYAFARPSRTREKLRRMERRAGSPRRRRLADGSRSTRVPRSGTWRRPCSTRPRRPTGGSWRTGRGWGEGVRVPPPGRASRSPRRA